MESDTLLLVPETFSKYVTPVPLNCNWAPVAVGTEMANRFRL